MLCEPILVYGPSPSTTSQAVWWLRDLIRPVRILPTSSDFRQIIILAGSTGCRYPTVLYHSRQGSCITSEQGRSQSRFDHWSYEPVLREIVHSLAARIERGTEDKVSLPNQKIS